MQLLSNHSIDKRQWDDCIASSPQNIIYAKSFYLDSMCSGWSALIDEDYKWVFPITHKTKWGVSYLYQPPFTQQLGIFARQYFQPPLNEIVQWLQLHYKFWEVSWNTSAITSSSSEQVAISKATNFVLDLSKEYDSIKAGYTNDLRKNLKRSLHDSLEYKPVADFKKCIDLYKEHYSPRMPHVRDEDYSDFRNLCALAQQHEMLICRAAFDAPGNIMAAVLLLTDGNRLYNLMNTTTEAGKRIGANHFLLDAVLKEFSGKNILFDFEGSDIPGVKQFYENFGAVNEAYYNVRYNALPWFIKLFKK